MITSKLQCYKNGILSKLMKEEECYSETLLPTSNFQVQKSKKLDDVTHLSAITEQPFRGSSKDTNLLRLFAFLNKTRPRDIPFPVNL